jgi:hypothetical protein
MSVFCATETARADPPPADAPPPRAVRLEYTVPPGNDCPDEATFKDRVRGRMRMRFDPFAADAPARVIVKLFPAETRGWFRGHAELRDSTGALLWERDAKPERCHYVASAFAFGLSIELNGPPPAAPPPSNAEPAQAAAEASPPPQPAAAPSTSQSVKTTPEPQPRPQSKRPLVGLYAGGSLVLWVVPFVPAGQVSAGVLLQWSRVYVALEGQWQPPGGADVESVLSIDGGSVRFSRLSAGPMGCVIWRFVHGCVVMQVGSVAASFSSKPPLSGADAGVWMGGRLVLQKSLDPHVAVHGLLDLAAAVKRPALRENFELKWAGPPVSVSLGASIVTFF